MGQIKQAQNDNLKIADLSLDLFCDLHLSTAELMVGVSDGRQGTVSKTCNSSTSWLTLNNMGWYIGTCSFLSGFHNKQKMFFWFTEVKNWRFLMGKISPNHTKDFSHIFSEPFTYSRLFPYFLWTLLWILWRRIYRSIQTMDIITFYSLWKNIITTILWILWIRVKVYRSIQSLDINAYYR